MSRRRKDISKGVVAIALALLLSGALFVSAARREPVRTELLRAKQGFEYVIAMVRLRLRNPSRDARDDLLRGDRELYCVGTFSCSPKGVDVALPEGFSIEGTATIGCVIVDGDLEMAYRRAEERYVTAYNRSKLASFLSDGRLIDEEY